MSYMFVPAYRPNLCSLNDRFNPLLQEYRPTLSSLSYIPEYTGGLFLYRLPLTYINNINAVDRFFCDHLGKMVWGRKRPATISIP